jgi:hypothetical protein
MISFYNIKLILSEMINKFYNLFIYNKWSVIVAYIFNISNKKYAKLANRITRSTS